MLSILLGHNVIANISYLKRLFYICCQISHYYRVKKNKEGLKILQYHLDCVMRFFMRTSICKYALNHYVYEHPGITTSDLPIFSVDFRFTIISNIQIRKSIQ